MAKYDAAGRRLWAAPLTRAGISLANPLVAADSTGAVTVAATARGASSSDGGYQTIRFTPDGRELWRGRDDPGQHDDVAALAIDGNDAALVTGTSWNGYGALGVLRQRRREDAAQLSAPIRDESRRHDEARLGLPVQIVGRAATWC